MVIRRLYTYARNKLKRFSKTTANEAVVKTEKKSVSIADSSAALSEDKLPETAQKKAVYSKPKKPPWNLDQFEVVPVEGKMRFHDFGLPLKLMRGIADLNFQYCTPIQEQALVETLTGKDMVGQANTGTGKSAVFLITIIGHLLKKSKEKVVLGHPRALIVAPTRELVTQITKDARDLAKYTPLRVVAVYGGVDYHKQIEMLENKRCDIIVATPGRLLDFMQKKIVHLKATPILVLDEADRLLDMGFIPDVRRIVGRMPEKQQRQTMMFSATITEEVRRLVYSWCHKPVNIEIEPEVVAVETVKQLTYMVTEDEKYPVLYNLIKQNSDESMMVFANQKNEAKHLADKLIRNGIQCVLLTGDVAQKQREKRLENFRAGRNKVLVATDVAGRGIHIEGVEYVVNYTLPYEPEDYVHRIGRTGRAGKSGISVSFACEKGSFYIPAIEAYIGKKLECTVPEEALFEEPPKPKKKATSSAKNNGYQGKNKRYQKPRAKGGRRPNKG